eukprot:scaffold7468_cov444-Prasinococcus_capsulatus_cf.AAC.1
MHDRSHLNPFQLVSAQAEVGLAAPRAQRVVPVVAQAGRLRRECQAARADSQAQQHQLVRAPPLT